MSRPLAFFAVVSLLLGVAPAVHAQPAARTPDLAQVALSQADVPGWQQVDALRDETWDQNQSAAPAAPSEAQWFQTRLVRQLSDGSQQTLTTRATQGRSDLAMAYFQSLQHSALGQTPIALPSLGDQTLGWWETIGNTRTATAATELGNLTLELHVTGVNAVADVGDEQVAAWLSRLVDRASAAPNIVVDWSQLLPDQPRPWQFVLDQSGVGDDWQPRAGLELAAHVMNGQVDRVTATREFERTAPYRRSVTSEASVYASAAAARDVLMTPDGSTALPAPSLGDAAAAFKSSAGSDGNDAPQVTYVVDVRRGNLVQSTRETGVAWSLDSSDEAMGMATTADARAAGVLAQ
jgi:hypothetical protein